MLKEIQGGVCAAKGFTASGVHAGIRKNKTKKDLALIYSATRAAAASVKVQHNTAKLFSRKIRAAIRIERERVRLEKIAGTVSIDETYFSGFGKARRLRGRSVAGKIPVIGVCQIENGKKRVRIERIQAAKSEIL